MATELNFLCWATSSVPAKNETEKTRKLNSYTGHNTKNQSSMNKLTKSAVLAVGVALVTQAAQAANNDLLLGFSGLGAGSDYVINFGQPTSVGVGGTTVVDLSGDFSLTTFNSIFTGAGSPNGVNMGVGGGTSSLNPVTFYTVARSGGAGVAATPGSTQPGNQTPSNASATAGFFNAIINAFTPLQTPPSNQTIATSDPNSWTSQILGTGGLVGQQGINPSSPIANKSVFEDLWQGTKVGTSEVYSYKGYFTFDLNGTTPVLDFTPAGVAVPEPSVYGIIAGAGLLVLSLRRQFGRRSA
jgi:hypothetical protein